MRVAKHRRCPDRFESTSASAPDEPIYLRLEDFDLVSTDVLIGQERIDFLRAEAEKDLEATVAVDPNHPGIDQIRRALADLAWEERQLHWRIERGFTRPDGHLG